MRVQLEQIRLEPYRWSEVLHIPAERLDNSEIVDLGDVTWRGEIRYAAPAFRLLATVEYDQTVRCQRCLEPVVLPERADLELAIFEDGAEVVPGEYELDESDFGVLYVDSDVVDLEPLLIEQMQLNVPMRTVCREDCKGLCPSCGADLNAGECGCGPPADPRWAELERLRSRLR